MCAHACRHIQNAKKYGIPVVIAINKFATDTDAELQAVKTAAKDAGRIKLQLCHAFIILMLVDMRLDVCRAAQCLRCFGFLEMAPGVSVRSKMIDLASLLPTDAYGGASMPLECSRQTC